MPADALAFAARVFPPARSWRSFAAPSRAFRPPRAFEVVECGDLAIENPSGWSRPRGIAHAGGNKVLPSSLPNACGVGRAVRGHIRSCAAEPGRTSRGAHVFTNLRLAKVSRFLK